MSIRVLRLATVLCFAAALVTGVQAIRLRQRAHELEGEFLRMGSDLSELRFQVDHAAARVLQYELQIDSLSRACTTYRLAEL